MSVSMTWANYALMVSLCVFIYYAVIVIVYRKTFRHLIARRANLQSIDSSEVSSSEDVSGPQNNLNLFGEAVPEEESEHANEAEQFPASAQDFATEIEAYTSSCDDSITKEVLVNSLHRIIQKYPALAYSVSRYELSQLIAMYCENYCSVHFSADEVQALWNDWVGINELCIEVGKKSGVCVWMDNAEEACLLSCSPIVLMTGAEATGK